MFERRRYRIHPSLWAVIIGLVVTSAGSLPWSVLVVLNIRHVTRVPWASVLMVLYLIAFVKYIGGWGPPPSTAAVRRRYLRAHSLPCSIWCWALVAGGSANAALAAALILVARVGWIHRSRGAFPAAPFWTIAVWLLTGAAVAGIAEECGFRGYMQRMLEDRYRAPVAIAVTSVVFGAIHLSHGFSIAILFDVAWGAVYGTLAFLTQSVLPSLVLHASLDALHFFVIWRFAGAFSRPLVSFDGAAWCTVAAGGVLSALAFWSFQRLYHLRCPES